MDFFQRVGNFFNGAGWVSDQEKKKKPQVVQTTQKQPVRVLNGQPTSPLLKPNTPQVNPLQKNPSTFKLPTLTPPRPAGGSFGDRLPSPSLAAGTIVNVEDRRGQAPVVVPKPPANVAVHAPYLPSTQQQTAQAIQYRAKTGAYKDPSTMPVGDTRVVDFRNPQNQPTNMEAAQQRITQAKVQKDRTKLAVTPADVKEKQRQISEIITKGKLIDYTNRFVTPEEEKAALIKRDEINAKIANKGKVSAGDIASEIGKATRDVTVAALRSIPRSAVQLGQDFTANDGYKADNGFAKFILGKDEVKSSKRTGQELLAGATGKDIKEFDNSGSAILGGVLAAADLIPGFGSVLKTAGKVAGKELLKEGLTTGVRETAKPIIKTLADLFAKPKETIENVIKRTSDNIAEQDAGNANQAIVHQADKTAEEARLAEEAATANKANESLLTDAERAAGNTKPAKPVTTPIITEEEAFRITEQTRMARNAETDRIAEIRRSNPDLNDREVSNLIADSQARMLKTEEDIRNSVLKSRGQVDEATAKAAQDLQAQQKVAEETKKAQQEAVAPADQGAPTTGASEELNANKITYNDAAKAVTDSTGTDTTTGLVKGNALYNNPISQFWNKLQQGYIEKVDAGREAASSQIQKGIQSGNKVTAGLVNAPKALFKNFGQNENVRSAIVKRTSQMQNAGRMAKLAWKNMEDIAQSTGNPAQVYQNIYRVFEEPAFLKRVYGDATKLTPDQLSPEEKIIFDKMVELNKMRNDINLQTGIISPESHAAFADGMHSPRVYDIEALGMPDYTSTKFLDRSAGIRRKDFDELPDAIVGKVLESPMQASMVRLESALKNLANSEALDNLTTEGALLDFKPNKNFVQLVGKKFGANEGKYIDSQLLSQIDGKDYYTSQMGQNVGNLIESYHDSPIGGLDRLFKSFKTVLSPGTFVGNVGSNIASFASAANVNPATASVRMAQGAKQLTEAATKGFNANVHRAELAGLFSGDTGRALTHSKSAQTAVTSMSKNPYNLAKDVYGGTDQSFALGLFNEFKARGLTDEQAVKRAHLAMQNYGNSGRVINALADSPVLGKPFARFTPELLRIMKNSAIYNPVGTSAKVAGLAAGGAYLSNQSGETTAERQARENTVGQTQLPGTGFINSFVTGGKNKDNVSLNLAIPHNSPILPDSSINIARATGLNYPIEPGGDANTALIRQLNPIADMTRKNAQGQEVFAPNQLVSSLTFRPIADQIANRDFMGRTITDPTNKVYYEGADGQKITKFSDQLSGQDQMMNRLRTAAMSYLPGANEVDAISNATTGNKDYYGKERTVPQAIARMFGIKTESNDAKVRSDRVDSKQYFEEDLPAVQNFVTQNPDLANSYFELKNPSRNRITNESSNDLVSPEKWTIIKGDTSGRLFNFLKEQAIKQSTNDPKKPIDPIYNALDPQQTTIVSDLRSRPTGDDIERQEILRATQPWYKEYEDKYYDYLDKNTEYFKNLEKHAGGATPNARVTEYGNASKPVEQPEVIKQYYQIKEKDAAAAKNFYNANKDALSTAFDTYGKDRLDRINKMRKIEGYDAIPLEVFQNKTFGFDVKGASGYGYGGGGGGASSVNNLDPLFLLGSDAGGNLPDTIKAKELPQIAQLLESLKAGSGGGRRKATLGASSRGQG